MEARDRQAAIDATAKGYYDARSHPLRPLKTGQLVRIQDAGTKLWDRVGTVVGVGRNRDYRVKTGSGAVMWRNRRFIRPQRPAADAPSSNSPLSLTRNLPSNQPAQTPVDNNPPTSEAGPTPRRSGRSRTAPDRLDL